LEGKGDAGLSSPMENMTLSGGPAGWLDSAVVEGRRSMVGLSTLLKREGKH
jgi:hypothetical protein